VKTKQNVNEHTAPAFCVENDGLLFDHQGSNNDEGTTSGPRWDGSKDWGEKDRNEEHHTHHDGRDTCLATLWSGHISFNQKEGIRSHMGRYAPAMPVADSMYAVTGEVPRRDPIVIETASTQYANVDPSKSSVTGSRRPANFAMEYRVLFRTLGSIPNASERRKRTRLYLETPGVRCNFGKYHLPTHQEYPRRAW